MREGGVFAGHYSQVITAYKARKECTIKCTSTCSTCSKLNVWKALRASKAGEEAQVSAREVTDRSHTYVAS